MDFEDLIGNVTNKTVEKEAENLRRFGIKIDLSDKVDKWLICAYIYALNNGLKEYQARSFASEFVLFKTGSIINTDVDFIYREDWLDSYLYDKFQEILADCDGEKDDLFWARFLGFLSAFYRSDKSWHYERVRHQLNVRVSREEYEMFEAVAGDKKIDKFVTLLQEYDSEWDFDFERKGKIETQLTFKMSQSVYDLFLSVKAKSKSSRFFRVLYQYHSKN